MSQERKGFSHFDSPGILFGNSFFKPPNCRGEWIKRYAFGCSITQSGSH